MGRPGSPVRRAGGILSARPQRTHTKPSPRPLPPPSADEEELIDPFKGRKLRRSPPPGVFPAALRQAPEPEPELPPTPTQKGLSDPLAIITSPAGIHNTPSKRPRRSRALAAKMNSSPLKQPPLRPPESAAAAETAAQTVSLRLAKEPLRDEPKRKRRKRKSHPARQVEEADPLADKKALRDVLLAEVAQLEDDLRVAARENERLYRVQESRRHTTVELPNEEERSRLLDVLRRHVLPPEKETPPDPMRDWLEAAMNPIAFLPFGRNNAAALPPLPLPGSENENGKAGEGEEKDLSPPVSHHPVPITAEEELPYLQVFTPLTFTSTVTTTTTTTTRQNNAQEEEGQEQEQEPPLLQRHAISVSSSPRGLFFATIDMVVDTKTLSIARLAVPRLDPAALSELGPFLEKTLGGDGPTRNVGVVAWAMGEWVRVATKRARFWYAVSRELGSTEKILRCAEAMRRGTKRKGRGREVDRGGDDDGEDEEDGGRGRDGDAGGRGDKAPSKADVIALLGRTSLDIDLSGVACDGDGGGGDDDYESLVARIQWRIEFDWTGEARSKIGLLMSAPAKCECFLCVVLLIIYLFLSFSFFLPSPLSSFPFSRCLSSLYLHSYIFPTSLLPPRSIWILGIISLTNTAIL